MPEVVTLVRIPIAEIENSIRAKHVLPKVLTDVHLEGDTLVLYFSDEARPNISAEEAPLSTYKVVQRKRRAHRKRNRMRTRGWEKVANFINSKGQKCAIYKPFVDALNNQKLTAEEQRKLVERILRANRNKPSDISIRYFLENTLEYLQNQALQTQPLYQKRDG
jgi:hypothetical protein